MPALVAGELRRRDIEPNEMRIAGLTVHIQDAMVDDASLGIVHPLRAYLQPADVEVFQLALADGFRVPVLTDDLTLRRTLEAHGAITVGSIGILLRAFAGGLMDRNELDESVDALFTRSTLHLSIGFRRYIQRLLQDL
jgi:hypothetical protein